MKGLHGYALIKGLRISTFLRFIFFFPSLLSYHEFTLRGSIREMAGSKERDRRLTFSPEEGASFKSPPLFSQVRQIWRSSVVSRLHFWWVSADEKTSLKAEGQKKKYQSQSQPTRQMDCGFYLRPVPQLPNDNMRSTATAYALRVKFPFLPML